MTAKPNNGVSCAARPLQLSPAPRGRPEPLSVDGTASAEVRRGVVRAHAETQQLLVGPPPPPPPPPPLPCEENNGAAASRSVSHRSSYSARRFLWATDAHRGSVGIRS